MRNFITLALFLVVAMVSAQESVCSCFLHRAIASNMTFVLINLQRENAELVRKLPERERAVLDPGTPEVVAQSKKSSKKDSKKSSKKAPTDAPTDMATSTPSAAPSAVPSAIPTIIATATDTATATSAAEVNAE